jgi:hypothetical protein
MGKSALKTIFMVLFLSFAVAFSTCAQGTGGTEDKPKENDVKLKITVGNKVFTAIMYDNATAEAFIAKLPMTLNMIEMNGNEKYYNLPENFRADSAIETIAQNSEGVCRNRGCGGSR